MNEPGGDPLPPPLNLKKNDIGTGGARAAESNHTAMALVAGKKSCWGRRTASELAYIITAQSDEYLKISSKENRVQTGTPKRWCKPTGDSLKINVDASYIAETSCGGWGFVIRDAIGAVIHAGAGAILYSMDDFHSEVLACLAALKAASEKGMTRIVVETDSMMLWLAIERNTFSLAPSGGLIHEIKALAASSFISFSVM